MPLSELNPEDARIFRITHRDNLEWILDHGLHARNGALSDPNFRKIGNRELIEKRKDKPVPAGNGGTLSDYVPFYFTPCSIMACNINTGHNGIEYIPNDDILIFSLSLRSMPMHSLSFVLTDQHAYNALAQFFTDLDHLNRIDWKILQNRDFKRDSDLPQKTDKYQAEALIWKHLPINCIETIGCHSEGVRNEVRHQLTKRGLNIEAKAKKGWYF
jgi:hypothetical protein